MGRVIIGGLVLISPLFLSSPSRSPPASLHRWYTSCSGLKKQITLFSILHFKSSLKKPSQWIRLEHSLSITFRREDLLPHRHLFKRKAKYWLAHRNPNIFLLVWASSGNLTITIFEKWADIYENTDKTEYLVINHHYENQQLQDLEC